MPRHRALLALLLVLLVLLVIPAPPVAIAASRSLVVAVAPDSTTVGVDVNVEARPAVPVTSALVTISGPSVYRQFAAMSATDETALTTDKVVARAGQLKQMLAAAEATVLRRQLPVVSAAQELGVTVVSHYTTVANGLLVHATAEQLAALRRVPGVARIEPAPIVRPALAFSVPHIGATRLASGLGYDGSGSVVAIIDTGVDYTHAHLGGPGTAEAWQAASAVGASETITDTWEGVSLFPNDKVIGGWDFVGDRYNPIHICTPADEEAGKCTSTPQPDPDPIDGGSHGTHVAGIVAGNAIQGIGDGVAPGAKLVGLKLYGRGGADEAADVLVDAIEWCARVNLGLEDRGVLPPKVDAINISLGEVQAQGSRMFDEAVEAAVGAGIVVASSAGNSGDRPFVTNSPSSSPKMLSIASSVPPQAGVEIEASWDGQHAIYLGAESSIGRPFRAVGRLEVDLAWFGRGCDDDEVFQDVNEKMALVERGSCVFPEKLLNAQAAGAIAVLMFTDNRERNGMGGSKDGIEIPAAMIDNQPGQDLVTLLQGGTAIRVVFDPDRAGVDMSLADSISGFSSRGPSRAGALKPDITGPGTSIVSAAAGTGSRGVAFSGTSMSGPHLAGAAALIHHRNRAENLGLGAADLAALLMNYARPVVFQTDGSGKVTVPVVRQGAGEVDLWRAGTGQLLVRAGDIASINIGALSLVEAQRIERQLSVRNLAADPITFRVEAALLYDEDVGQGLVVETPAAPITLAGGAKTTVRVVFALDPEQLRTWNLRPAAGASAGAVGRLELDGYVTLTPLDDDGNPYATLPSASVPFYVLPRQASAVSSRGRTVVGDGDQALRFVNTAPYTGTVELFIAPPVTTTGLAAEDPDDADVTGELDLRWVGVRIEPPTEAVTRTMVTFGLARHERAAIPQVTRYELYIDANRDGAPDVRVREGAQGDRMRTYFGAWDAAAGAIVGDEFVTNTLHATDLHTHLTMLSLPLASLGITETVEFDFLAINRGLNEDWLHTPSIDVAPDGALADGGPRYHFGPNEQAVAPAVWSFAAPGHGHVDVPLVGRVDLALKLLAFYPDNRFEGVDRQLQVLPGGKIFLPFAVRPQGKPAPAVPAQAAGRDASRLSMLRLNVGPDAAPLPSLRLDVDPDAAQLPSLRLDVDPDAAQLPMLHQDTSIGPDAAPLARLPIDRGPDAADRSMPAPESLAPHAAELERWTAGVLADLPDQEENPFAAVDACVAAEMTQRGVPGASIAIAVNGVITYTKGYGVKNIEKGGEIDAETMFRFGSTLKMMTAAAVMQLVEQRKIDLQAPITRYLPYFDLADPWDPASITTHHLLTHSSGFPDQTFELDSTLSLKDWASRQGQAWLNVPPGSFWNYSNPNFSLAGLIVQERSGIPYPRYMREKVWNPAGMPLTTLNPRDVLDHGNYTWGHKGGAAAYSPTTYDNPYMAPAGYGFSTPTALATWALLLGAGGGDVLSSDSAAAMQSAQIPTDLYPWFNYGYGVMVEDFQEVADPSQLVTVRHHGGNISGWSSQLYWLPGEGFAVSILGNTIDSLTSSAYCVLREVAGLEPIPLAGHTTDPATWGPYTGTYSMLNEIGMSWTAQVILETDELFIDNTDLWLAGGRKPLQQIMLDRFKIPDSVEDFTFIGDESQPVRWMRNRSTVGERVGSFPPGVAITGTGCSPITFTPAFDMPNLAGRAYGPASPLHLAGVPIAKGNPIHPDQTAFKHKLTLSTNTGLFVAVLLGEPDDDLDLYVLYDKDFDGQFSFPKEVAWVNQFFIGRSSTEAVILPGPQPPGDYQVLVHGASVEGEDSKFDLYVLAIDGSDLRLTGVPGSVTANESYEAEVCGTARLRGEAPKLGLVELTYGSPPRRVNVMVDWRPTGRPEIFLPANLRLGALGDEGTQ